MINLVLDHRHSPAEFGNLPGEIADLPSQVGRAARKVRDLIAYQGAAAQLLGDGVVERERGERADSDDRRLRPVQPKCGKQHNADRDRPLPHPA